MPCNTVTVEEPVVDDSKLEFSSYSAASKDPGEVSIAYVLNNVVTSGNGEELSGNVSITVDGSEAWSTTVTLPAGDSASNTRTLTGVASGDRNICVTVTESGGGTA